MDLQNLNNYLHFYLLGPYYVLEDNCSAYRCNFDLGNHEGKVAIVTGGHRGIGAFITKDLLSAGFHVILAGIITSDFEVTEDGLESQWQVNHLAHFLLCHLLLPTLQATPGNTRIVNVTSLEHKTPLQMDYQNINNKDTYNGMTAYGRSKLAQVMFTLYLNSKLLSVDSSVQVIAAHPGIVNTEIFDGSVLKKYFPFIPQYFFKTPEKGAKPIVYACLYGKGGEYIGNCRPQTPSKLARDASEQAKLFEESKKALDITLFGNLF